MTAGSWSFATSIVGLVIAAGAILWAGFRVTSIVDELADRTGIGEAIAGGALLGAVTSLSGLVTLAVGGLRGDAGFALSNPLGGIALQTVWLAVADLLYRRANLEHAAASLQNVMQAVLLTGLLAIPVVGFATPRLNVPHLNIHPVTFAIPVLYGLGLVLVRRMQNNPMWNPQETDETVQDVPETEGHRSMTRLWVGFAGFGLVLAIAGWITGEAGLGLVQATGLSGSLVGSTFTTAASSMSELVTLIAAIRIGALTLGVGDIIGGNLFDLLQIGLADAFYRAGPVYVAAGDGALVLTAGCILISAVMAAGLLLREKKGIGFEGVTIPIVWAVTIAGVAITG